MRLRNSAIAALTALTMTLTGCMPKVSEEEERLAHDMAARIEALSGVERVEVMIQADMFGAQHLTVAVHATPEQSTVAGTVRQVVDLVCDDDATAGLPYTFNLPEPFQLTLRNSNQWCDLGPDRLAAIVSGSADLHGLPGAESITITLQDTVTVTTKHRTRDPGDLRELPVEVDGIDVMTREQQVVCPGGRTNSSVSYATRSSDVPWGLLQQFCDHHGTGFTLRWDAISSTVSITARRQAPGEEVPEGIVDVLRDIRQSGVPVQEIRAAGTSGLRSDGARLSFRDEPPSPEWAEALAEANQD